MRVVVAPNALRGSLDAFAAADAMGAGIKREIPDADVVLVPIADGGDGTARVLVGALGGAWETVEAVDALGRVIAASFAIIEGGATAVIEVASASGIARLDTRERDPRRATSYGT